MKVVIVDYGLGNLRSVAGAVERVGHSPTVSNDIHDLTAADKMILPGVGAFADGMANLHRLGLVEPLAELVNRQCTPILGICLGAQIMAQESSEFGCHQGLGWIDASVVKFEPKDNTLKVPHVGWDDMQQVRKSILFENIPAEAVFYYVHSYWIRSPGEDFVIGECEYGTRFTAAFERGNIYGTQFHPEKSQLHGLTLLRNFLDKA